MNRESQEYPTIDWASVLRRYMKKGGTRSFMSEIGFCHDVLNHTYYKHLYNRRISPDEFITTCSWMKNYKAHDSSHGWFDIGYNKHTFLTKNVVDNLQGMDLISWDWILLDQSVIIDGKLVAADVDTTEFAMEKPKNDRDRTRIWSGKANNATLKYELVSTTFVGYILSQCGPVDGPAGDQVIVRDVSFIEDSVKFYQPFFNAKPHMLGDGHYTNFDWILSRNDFRNAYSRYCFHARRAKIENVNAEVKNYQIMNKDFRHRKGNLESKKKFHSKIFNVITNMINLKKLLRYGKEE